MATVNLGMTSHRGTKLSATESQERAKRFHGRLKFDATFCPTDVADPFDTVTWETRSAAIKGENGEVLFEQTNCEVPSFWSQLATNVICSKYFYGEVGTDEREYSVRQLVHRVARTIADWGLEDGYFASPADGERFYRDLAWLCLHQHGAFNSPVWFNVGLYHQYGVTGAPCNWRWDPVTQEVAQPENPYEFPQGSACFIQHVQDNMEDIMELARSEAMLFKFGSGTGTDLSTLRSHREKLSGGGRPSGPLSFMRVYDQIAAVVKSGGKTRRAAKMQSIKVWHPDVMEFIECKWKEEQKARVLIEKGGYEPNFNGEAYSSIMFQNANLSVRVTDDFMQAVERNQDWTTHWVTDANIPGPTYPAREMISRMADCAWHCGDPGVQYDTTINDWHTCPNSGRINASNPCVTGDTLVATSEGLIPIKDLVGQTPEVVGSDGKLHRVKRVIPTGRKQVYRLRTKSGFELRVTADHKVHTSNRGDVPAKELGKGDWIAVRAPRFGSEYCAENAAEIVGLTLGCGLFSHHLNCPMEGEADRGPELFENILSTLENEHDEPGGGVATAVGLSAATMKALSRYAMTADGPKNNRLTSDALQLDRESCAALLRGLFTAEGSVDEFLGDISRIRLNTTSLELTKQVQLLLLAFGIKSELRSKYPANSRVVRKAFENHSGRVVDQSYPRGYALVIGRPYCSAFQKNIGFMEGSEKAELLSSLNLAEDMYRPDVQHDAFSTLDELEVEDVYDLTEPVTSHFVANGLVVHNCSEYMFLDDTACNLASINLMKFREPDGTFDAARFQTACRTYFIAQEILVDHASYPTRDIARNSHLFRPLGLGYSNLGSLLMAGGMAYDSDAARGVCGAITALLHGAANLTSCELAEAVGTFDEYEPNHEPFLRVMQMHRDAVEKIEPECPAYLVDAARRTWDEVLAAGRVHGFRNAQATVLAPTGTISFMMDCDTTGIEPDIALVKYKQLAGGGMLKIVNQTVPLALRTLGYDQPQIESILGYINTQDTIEGTTDLKAEHLPVFDCAFSPRNGKRSIAWHAHVSMMAAAQPFLSGAISKTVNMPRETTPEEIAQAYLDGWKLGLKALAIYRDGSKESQPLNTGTEADRLKAKETAKPRRERLPDTRNSITHKFSISGHEGYLTVGLFEDGRPGELFITMAKEGSTIGGLMDAFGTSVSMSLQYGVPLEDYVRKFSHMRFEPQGYTKNPDIRIAKSIIDYIFRWLGNRFLPGYKEATSGVPPKEGPEAGGQRSGGDPELSEPKPVDKKSGGLKEQGERKAESGELKAESHPEGTRRKAEAGDSPISNPQSPIHNGNGNGHTNGYSAKLLERAGVLVKTDDAAGSSQNDQFASFQSDAPVCDGCGSITVRSGNCYLCYNCGTSMGCS